MNVRVSWPRSRDMSGTAAAEKGRPATRGGTRNPPDDVCQELAGYAPRVGEWLGLSHDYCLAVHVLRRLNMVSAGGPRHQRGLLLRAGRRALAMTMCVNSKL
eukprot:7402662-Pyramimonas_sp.AAC.1